MIASCGDYRYAISHQLDTPYGKHYIDPHELIAKGTGAWRRGKLTGFIRQLGAVRLLEECMSLAFGRRT